MSKSMPILTQQNENILLAITKQQYEKLHNFDIEEIMEIAIGMDSFETFEWVEKNFSPAVFQTIYPKNNTLLHLASTKGNVQIIKMLLENHVDPNLKNLRGETCESILKDKNFELSYRILKNHLR